MRSLLISRAGILGDSEFQFVTTVCGRQAWQIELLYACCRFGETGALMKLHPRVLVQILLCATLAVLELGCGSSSPIIVTITPTSGNAAPGQTLPFSASTSNGSSVNWSVSCSTPPCGSVSPNSTASGGSTTYTAPPTALANSLTITVTAAASSSASAQATVTFPPYQASVWSDSGSVNPGMTTNLYAQAVSGPANATFDWTLSCTPAPCGTLSTTTTQSGAATVYTAPPSPPLAGLTVNYTAKSSANPSISASGSIQVLGVTVSLSPSSANVLAAGTQQFIATVTNDPTNGGVTFSVSCSPAPCGSIPTTPTPSGTPITYTGPPTPPPSNLSVTVTAASVAYSGATATATVSVPAITVSVSPGSALIPLNSNLQFTATVANDPASAGVTWTLTQSATSCTPTCGSASASNPTTFTPPASMPATSAVTLNATSVTDNTKSASATINLSTGTVQLVPQSLNFGRHVVNQPSTPQPIALTNTGTASLTFTGVTFTGTNATDFSQTNTCGSSVAAAASCTISVVFKPAAQGTRSATMSIADSSTDSPQQVSLAGIGITRRASNVSAVHSVLASSTIVAVPLPTGSERVGTRILDWVDRSRPDPFVAHSISRELLVRLWYPASLNQPCEAADYASPRVWSYFSHLLGVPLPAVQSNSCLNAPVASGMHPVVVFTHGYTGTFTDYTFLFEDLASRGYIVVSVNHTYEATATEFPDGRFVTSVLGSHLDDTWRGDDKTLALATSTRLQDLRFVVNQLQQINTRKGDPFARRLDLSRLAVAGHSAGGTVAFLGLERDSRFKAAVILDGFLSSAEIRPTTQPVLMMTASPETDAVDRCALLRSLRGPHTFVSLRGAEHLAPSDALWLARGAIAAGPMGTDGALAAIRDDVASFLDTYLRERSSRRLVSNPSSANSDAALGTGDQSCSQP